MRRSSRLQVKKKLNYELLNKIGDGNASEIEDFYDEDQTEETFLQADFLERALLSGDF